MHILLEESNGISFRSVHDFWNIVNHTNMDSIEFNNREIILDITEINALLYSHCYMYMYVQGFHCIFMSVGCIFIWITTSQMSYRETHRRKKCVILALIYSFFFYQNLQALFCNIIPFVNFDICQRHHGRVRHLNISLAKHNEMNSILKSVHVPLCFHSQSL